jgi:glycerol dehydrogenase-like iron-containing ADH family enzyme
VTIPTNAATCSAASTVAVVYENGIRTAVIAAAPARRSISGG